MLAVRWGLTSFVTSHPVATKIRIMLESYGDGVNPAKVTKLVPVAQLRDALWCLVELQAVPPPKQLASYAKTCLSRLGIES